MTKERSYSPEELQEMVEIFLREQKDYTKSDIQETLMDLGADKSTATQIVRDYNQNYPQSIEQKKTQKKKNLSSIVANDPKVGERGKNVLLDTLEAVGVFYSAFLGTATIGAIGGLAYSLIAGDPEIGKSVIVGASLFWGALEPLVLMSLIIDGASGLEY